MVNKITKIKNVQQTPDCTPFVYLDQVLCEIMGLRAKTPVEIVFDIDLHEISIRPVGVKA